MFLEWVLSVVDFKDSNINLSVCATVTEPENLIHYFLGSRDIELYLGHGLKNSANVGHQLMVGGQDCLNGCHFIFNSILECNKRVINVKQTTITCQSRPNLDFEQSKLLHVMKCNNKMTFKRTSVELCSIKFGVQWSVTDLCSVHVFVEFLRLLT